MSLSQSVTPASTTVVGFCSRSSVLATVRESGQMRRHHFLRLVQTQQIGRGYTTAANGHSRRRELARAHNA